MISNLDTKDIRMGRRIGSFTLFNSDVDGRTLTFIHTGNLFVDNETNSSWNFVGECVDGSMKGKKLTPEVYGLDFAFAFLAFHSEAVVYSR
jgi:hypothetical protein